MFMSQRRYDAPILQICIHNYLKNLRKKNNLSKLKCTKTHVRQCGNQQILGEGGETLSSPIVFFPNSSTVFNTLVRPTGLTGHN